MLVRCEAVSYTHLYAPKTKNPRKVLIYRDFLCFAILFSGETGIRTPGTSQYNGFQAVSYTHLPYITADYNSYNGMNGNNINDIYVDEEERIWLANYPTGITTVSYTHLA